MLSNLNNIIIFLKDSIVINALNYENSFINKSKFSYNKGNWCYGMAENIIAINDLRQI